MIVPAGLSADALRSLDALLAEAAGLAGEPPAVFRILTDTERQFLEALRRAMPEPVPIATLWLVLTQRRDWPVPVGRYQDPQHLVDAHVSRLRIKLAAAGIGLRIDTVRARQRSGGMRALRLCADSETGQPA